MTKDQQFLKFSAPPREEQHFALPEVDFDGSLRQVGYLLAGQSPKSAAHCKEGIRFVSIEFPRK